MRGPLPDRLVIHTCMTSASFLLRELFHAADFFVGHLLDFFEGALLFVLADLLFFGEFLEGVVAVAADVADRGAVLFEDLVQVLADVAAALLGHGRNGDAHDLAVGMRIEAEIGGLDGLFDLLAGWSGPRAR